MVELEVCGLVFDLLLILVSVVVVGNGVVLLLLKMFG